jgi:ribosome biogenesis protein Nip4
MEALKKFVEQFCPFDLQNVHAIGRRYYLVEEALWKIKGEIPRDVYALGTYLGEEKKYFYPSTALLEIIAKKSSKKIVVNERGEWLFTCKRDVFMENVLKSNVDRGLCLVQNEHDENIGYGIIDRKGKATMIRPLLDKGDFLRREG